MPFFSYVALQSQGKKQKSVLEASHIQEAKEKLRSQGLIILKLVPQTSALRKSFFKRRQKQLKGDLLITITNQLSELMKAKVPLYESLISIEEMYRGEPFHYLLQQVTEDIKSGCSLSMAMEKFPHSFSPLYLAMVRAGEAVGTLDMALSKLTTLLTRQNLLKKKLVTSLIYPALLCAFSFFVIITLLVFVIPSLQALFAEREVNGFTKIVFALSHFVTHKWPLYLPGAAIGATSLFYLVKKRKDEIYLTILQLPFLKKVVIESGLARFSRTLSTLLQGGVGMKEALAMSKGVFGFPPLEKVIEEAEKKIIEGSLLSIEMKKSPLIPPLVARMIMIGEEGGNISGMLQKVANFYEEEVEKRLSRLTALSGPVILIIMGGVVGMIMMSVLLPLTDVSMFIE
jgi:general secretion pathway protein F